MKYILDRIKDIYNYYGSEVETKKFYEELEEVKKAVKNEDRENLIEELADVFITSRHMMNRFNILEEEIYEKILVKVSRQENRIRKEQIENLSKENKKKLGEYINKKYIQQGGK